MSCPDGFSVHLYYIWEGKWDREPISHRQRNIIKDEIRNGKIVEVVTGRVLSWESDFIDTVYSDGVYGSLEEWHENCITHSNCNGNNEDEPERSDYFTVDPFTQARCFPSGGSPSPTPSNGKSSPPPKKKKEMCCPCDVIATMFERNMAEKARQSELVKNHIDQRFIEALKNINQQLGAIQIDLDLDPVIQEIRQVRTDLWNGVGGKD